MKLNKLHEVIFENNEVINTATLSNPNELIILFNSGNVIRYKLNTKEQQHLFSVIDGARYSDGGFDLEADSSIYTLDDIVVVVNNHKKHGVIHYPEKYKTLRLLREDYYAGISYYPITLFKDEQGIPHIVYSVAWNHVQIMNLDTRQVLTAAKSLIEENAEEDHIEFYKKHNEANMLMWPRPYDYFYGELMISPDHKHFLSAGWAWGSCDAYNVYNIDDFITNNRIKDISIGGWEHDCRATCWIDHETIAVAYSPLMEGDDGATSDTPNEIHLYKLTNNKTQLFREIQVGNLNIVNTVMNYSTDLNAIVVYSNSIGVIVLSLDGEVLYENTEVQVNSYCPNLNLLLSISDSSASVNTITKRK